MSNFDPIKAKKAKDIMLLEILRKLTVIFTSK